MAAKMADPKKVLESSLKFRDGRKWKRRYCVLQKISPVSDCLHICLYKDKADVWKNSAKSGLSLENFFGIDSGYHLDKETHVMAIICKDSVITLAFDSHRILNCWLITIRTHLGEEAKFSAVLVKSPPSLKLPNGLINVFIHRGSLCIATESSSGLPPKYLASWKVSAMRRFGILNGQYCFEVADHIVCGIFVLDTKSAPQIDFLLKEMMRSQSLRVRSSSSSARFNESGPRYVSPPPVLISSASSGGNISKSKGDLVYAMLNFGQTDSEGSEDENEVNCKVVVSGSAVGREVTAWKVPAKSGTWLSNRPSAADLDIHCLDVKSTHVEPCAKSVKSDLLLDRGTMYDSAVCRQSMHEASESGREPTPGQTRRHGPPSDRVVSNETQLLAKQVQSAENQLTSDDEQSHSSRRYSYGDAFSSCIKYVIGTLTSHSSPKGWLHFSRSLSHLCCSSMVQNDSCAHATNECASNVQQYIDLLEGNSEQVTVPEKLGRSHGLRPFTCEKRTRSAEFFWPGLQENTLAGVDFNLCDLPFVHDASTVDCQNNSPEFSEPGGDFGQRMPDSGYAESILGGLQKPREFAAIECNRPDVLLEWSSLLDNESSTDINCANDVASTACGSLASECGTVVDRKRSDLNTIQNIVPRELISKGRASVEGGLSSLVKVVAAPTVFAGSGSGLDPVEDGTHDSRSRYSIHGSLKRTDHSKDELQVSTCPSHASNSDGSLNLCVPDDQRTPATVSTTTPLGKSYRKTPSGGLFVDCPSSCFVRCASLRRAKNSSLTSPGVSAALQDSGYADVSHPKEGSIFSEGLFVSQNSGSKNKSNIFHTAAKDGGLSSEVTNTEYVTRSPNRKALDKDRNKPHLEEGSGISCRTPVSIGVEVYSESSDASCPVVSSTPLPEGHRLQVLGDQLLSQKQITCGGTEALDNNPTVWASSSHRSRLLSDSLIATASWERKQKEFSSNSGDAASGKTSTPKRSFSLFSRFWRRSYSRSSQSAPPAASKAGETQHVPCASNPVGGTSSQADLTSKRPDASVDGVVSSKERDLLEFPEVLTTRLTPARQSALPLSSQNSDIWGARDSIPDFNVSSMRKGETSPLRSDPSALKLLNIYEDDLGRKSSGKYPASKMKSLTRVAPGWSVSRRSGENQNRGSGSASSCSRQFMNSGVGVNMTDSSSTFICTEGLSSKESKNSSRWPSLTVAVSHPNDSAASSQDRSGRTKEIVQVEAKSMTFPLRHLVEPRQRQRLSSDQSELSDRSEASFLSSCSSSNSHSSDSHKQTTNIYRPRSGKEYRQVNRKKLLDENQSTPALSSPVLASSIFTFDLQNNSVGRYSNSGDDSPKYPLSTCSQITSERSRAYANLSLGCDGSLIISDDVAVYENQFPVVNYAEIDLTASPQDASRHLVKPFSDHSPTIYAQIDMVATRAASQASLEHARQREDNTDRLEKRASLKGTGNRTVFRKASMPAEKRGSADQKNGLYATSKDRKFSPV